MYPVTTTSNNDDTLNLPLAGMFETLLRTPRAYLTPLVLLVCILGVYSVRGSALVGTAQVVDDIAIPGNESGDLCSGGQDRRDR